MHEIMSTEYELVVLAYNVTIILRCLQFTLLSPSIWYTFSLTKVIYTPASEVNNIIIIDLLFL